MCPPIHSHKPLNHLWWETRTWKKDPFALPTPKKSKISATTTFYDHHYHKLIGLSYPSICLASCPFLSFFVLPFSETTTFFFLQETAIIHLRTTKDEDYDDSASDPGQQKASPLQSSAATGVSLTVFPPSPTQADG